MRAGETISEGGFAPNRVSAASLLDVSTEKDNKGKTYYKYEILTRTGEEAGRSERVLRCLASARTGLARRTLLHHPRGRHSSQHVSARTIRHVRTGDGNEGGRHQLIKATVSNGNLYILKVQAGDKRWFKGAKKECLGVFDSFTVA